MDENRTLKELAFLSMFVIFNLYLLSSVKGCNKKSFNEVSKTLFAAGPSGGNVRTGPSMKSRIKFKIPPGNFTTLLERKKDWFRIRHSASNKEGWAHKVTMRRYLHLGYYKDFIIDKSVLELTWD